MSTGETIRYAFLCVAVGLIGVAVGLIGYDLKTELSKTRKDMEDLYIMVQLHAER